MKNPVFLFAKLSAVVVSLLFLSACGGGGGSSSENSLPTAWQKDVYPDPAALKSYCESPRAEANRDDKQGSTFLEKMWLRSWSDDVYLWYRELTDIDVAPFSTPQDYFDTRKTNAITASGVPRDQFHFYVDTAQNEQQVSSGSSVSYGMKLRFLQTAPPRKAVVIYVEPDSPADNANIVRGTEIISVDGADFVFGNNITTLNNGLFPESANERHSFEILTPGATSERTVLLTSAVIAEDPVQNTTYFTETSTGDNVGYLTFNTFGTLTAEKSLVNSFNYLSNNNVSDLVLDLRYNGGGFLAISAQLAYMIAGDNNSLGKTFYKTVFNDKYPNTDPASGNPIRPFPFIDTGIGGTVDPSVDLPSLNLDRVFVLTTGSTCSASEALMNGLQGIGVEVIQIGEKTCGKPYGFTGTDNCGTTYFTVMFQGVNDVGFGDYPDGFYPANSSGSGSKAIEGCEVADDLSNPLGDINEAMLNAALEYRTSSTCPATSAFRSTAKAPLNQTTPRQENDLLSDDRVRSKLLLEQVLIK